jgi:hypothetical protein
MLVGLSNTTTSLQDIQGTGFGDGTWGTMNAVWTTNTSWTTTGYILSAMLTPSVSLKATNQILSSLKHDSNVSQSTLKGLNYG